MEKDTENQWVIAYMPSGGRPATAIGAFVLDRQLSVPIYQRRRFDLDDPADLAAFREAQYAVGKSPRYRAYRVAVLPVSYFAAAIAVNAEQEAAEAKAVQQQPPTEPEPTPAPEPDPESDSVEGPAETPVEPYETWSLGDLREEAAARNLELPEGEDGRRKAPWVELLEKDDEATAEEE